MDYLQTLERWHQIQAAIKLLTAEERSLREGLFGGTFPNPREGVNSFTLPDGRVLKGTYVINRNMSKERWLQHYKTINLPKDVREALIVVKYDFDMKTYRDMPADLRKKFDTVLDIKPGLPKLELVMPKEKK